MYIKRDYFDDKDKLFAERYFVYQNAPGGAPKPAEAAPSKPGEEPGKPATLEEDLKDAKDKIKIVKDSIDAVKAKYPKAAERSEKFKALGKKLDEINKEIQEAEKAVAEKKQEEIKKVKDKLDAIISEISAPAVAAPAKPAAAPAPAPAPAATPDKPAPAPAKAPAKGPAKAPESDLSKEKALHESVIKEIKDASEKGKTCSEIIKNVKLAMEKIKDKSAFKDLYEDFNKQLDAAQAKVNRLKSFGSETKGLKALRGKIGEALGKYQKRVDEVLAKPAAKPDKPAPAPAPTPAPSPEAKPQEPSKPLTAPAAAPREAKPESKEGTESAEDAAKRALGKYLDEVGKDPDKFPELRLRLTLAVDKILQKNNIDLKDVKERQVIDLPGGYSMAIAKWPSNADKMPNAMIYKGRDLVCYKDYGILKQARKGQIPDAGYEAAQVIKCFNQFPKSFRTMKSEDGKNDKFKITNEEDFVLMGIELARYSRQDRPWTTNLASGRISYNPADKLLTIGPKGVAFQIVFNPNDTGKIGVIDAAGSKIRWEKIGSYIETTQDKEARVKEENTEAEKHLKDTVKQKVEERKEAARKVKEDTEKEEKKGNEKVDGLIDPKFKNIVSKSVKNSVTIKADEKDKQGLALINNTTIDKLIDLKQIRTEMASITIKAPGKSDRKGLYYPGQKTVYEVDAAGKQTNNRMKFYNGDTISFEFKNPEKSDEAKLNNDKSAENSVERIDARVAFDNLASAVKKFVEGAKGKIEDLDLKSLNQFKEKNKNYDPSKILTAGNWTKENIKNFKIEEAVAIMKEETKIIKEATDRKLTSGRPKPVTK